MNPSSDESSNRSGYEEGANDSGEDSSNASSSSPVKGIFAPPGAAAAAAATTEEKLHQSPTESPTMANPRLHMPSPQNVSAEESSPMRGSEGQRLSPRLTPAAAENISEPAVRGGRLISNNPNDEWVEVQGAEAMSTPRASRGPSRSVEGDARHLGGGAAARVGLPIENAPHDEAIPVSSPASHVATPMTIRSAQQMRPDDDDDDDDNNNREEEEEEEEETEDEDHRETGHKSREHRAEGYAGQKPGDLDEAPQVAQAAEPQLGYNPDKYARINASASRELQELFKKITKYEPFVAELPAKLRPFIPDYIPAIGDLDPFVKIPRPDGEPDGLGLYVVDEPVIPQSNPAVVLLELNATHAHGVAADVVDSLENAANRPEVIDRWISDIKKVHYKKALPTVNYQRPMPDIETLMQLWPQPFEEVLNSDVAFPPSHIDLDLDQYVRTLCSIVDIPTYSSLIDSLHVMFTLYEEFRSNQHFQHV